MLVQYRDFLFRRIFGRNQEHGVQDILQNVRELCRLDTSYAPGHITLFCLRLPELRRMFVSRAVAAEVLMEAETNRMGYAALKTLDREGGLRFSLAYVFSFLLECHFIYCGRISSLVEDLVKVTLSSIIYPGTTQSRLDFSRLSGCTQSRQPPQAHRFVTYGKIIRAGTRLRGSSCF